VISAVLSFHSLTCFKQKEERKLDMSDSKEVESRVQSGYRAEVQVSCRAEVQSKDT
jgi:hypothetical protein